MADRALRWTDELIPRVAVRQLVLTVPWPRRLLLARRPELARGVLRCTLAEVTRWLRREGVRRGEGGEPGTVTVMQRFGAALNLNLHFHVLLLDGLYVADAKGVPRFRRARHWRQADVDALIVRIAARCEAWLARRGFGTDEERDDDDPDDALPLLQSASVAACPTCGKVMVLRAEVRPPAMPSVLASLERSARGPPAGAESAART